MIFILKYLEGEAQVRLRKDGVLQEQLQFKQFLMDNYNAIITRLKIMSGVTFQKKDYLKMANYNLKIQILKMKMI